MDISAEEVSHTKDSLALSERVGTNKIVKYGLEKNTRWDSGTKENG